MAAKKQLVAESLDLWSTAIREKSSAGRGNGKTLELYGIKKLRELILELAVRGLLVSQDPRDESAESLLKRAEKERLRLVDEGKLRKQEPLPILKVKEHPYTVPKSWAWARLGSFGHIFNGNSISSSTKEEKYTGVDGLPFIATKDVRYGFERLDYENGIFIPAGEDTFKIAPKGAVLICAEGGSAGKKCGITDRDICFGNKLFANQLYGGISPRFILSVYLSPTFFSNFSQAMTGIIGGISSSKFLQLPSPLPPLAEQHRIAAKVDELLALCNRLEKQQENSLQTHQTLVKMLLESLTTASDSNQFDEAWQRIDSNFDTLFTTESSIAELQQTILQLAVMGKLVAQDPNDEPAAELLTTIAAEKAKLARAGVIRNSGPLPPIAEDEAPFRLHHSWRWCRLGQTGIGSTGKTPKTDNASNFGGEIEFIGPGQITPTGKLLKSDKTLTEEGVEESTEALPGDVLMVCIGGSIGKSVVADRRIAFNQQINAIHPIKISSHYLNHAVSTDRFYSSVLAEATGSATPIINRSKWEELLVPIPPANEQRRIVAKVDELLTLCDQLKASLKTTQATQLNLADSIVGAAIN